jgi:hypothetical protein
VASSSAAKNDNANQVVGLDSGSGTPTQGSVLRVDGSDTNTQQTQDQGVVPTVDIIALEDDDEGEGERERKFRG